MARERSYTDEQLDVAISSSYSWREALRALGLLATSAGAMRSVRARADRLGISYSHFRGQRRWTDEQLRDAVAGSGSWQELARRLGVDGSSSIAALKGHAARLALDTGHLSPQVQPPADRSEVAPDIKRLGRAGPLLAAAWFTLCGQDVSWPLEPSRYDLLVGGEGGIRRVQVKTTTVRASESWKVYLSTTGKARRTYDLAEIDDFFVIDGDLTYYLIPIAAVGGLHALHLSAYARYRLQQAW
ncbi:group I intron-associated PD-(D/E)XK endonuclease [Krasilnikoviella flava]|uniref:group I intron-associated PD-(D/E)XK endonuclease n=1 Tax=Krasilnikoviella flava TaxID=526729 RepID=UPI0009A7B3A9|nr:group I intron-associated PD-(D/E)XK endonuclease [Krasilnikoviella flava]